MESRCRRRKGYGKKRRGKCKLSQKLLASGVDNIVERSGTKRRCVVPGGFSILLASDSFDWQVLAGAGVYGKSCRECRRD